MRGGHLHCDVRGGWGRNAYGQRDNRTSAKLSDKCRSTWEWVRECADEARRRRSCEQRQKRAWGAKQHAIAPKLHKRPHCCRAEHVLSEYIGMGMGGELGSDWCLHASAGFTESCCERVLSLVYRSASNALFIEYIETLSSVKISHFPSNVSSRAASGPLDHIA